MGGMVRVNSRTVVTTKSGGTSIAFGDACEMPGGTVVPFFNIAVSEDLAGGAGSVRVNGVPVAIATSRFSKSAGDEPGEKGGVISHTTCGSAAFTTTSTDVRIEGQGVPRAFDSMVHNLDAQGIPNAASPMEMQEAGAVDEDFETICVAICACHAAGLRGECVQVLLATPIWSYEPKPRDLGGGSTVYWDPRVPPAFYVEPAFRMEPPPPEPMLSPTIKSRNLRHAGGNPLPLPGGHFPPLEDSRRPDVVVPIDPTKPLGPRNIKRIFEIKFPGDKPRKGQLDAYRKIAGGDRSKVTLVSPEKCDCAGKRMPDPKYIPVPVPMKKKAEEREPEPMKSKVPLVVGVAAAVGFVVVLIVTKNPGLATAAGAAAGAAVALATEPTNKEQTQ